MELPTVRKLMGLGWTYCPRCDDNLMIPEGQGWHCPFCGIGLAISKMPPVPPTELMIWSESLTGEEMMREYELLQHRAIKWVEAHKDIPPPKLPWRLVWFIRLGRPVAWLLGCQVMGLRDKKNKEVQSGR